MITRPARNEVHGAAYLVLYYDVSLGGTGPARIRGRLLAASVGQTVTGNRAGPGTRVQMGVFL